MNHGYERYRVENVVSNYICHLSMVTDCNQTYRGDHLKWIEILSHYVM